MYKPHTQCRACGSDDLVSVLNLGFQPLANNFHKPDDEVPGRAPLEVMFCPICTLAQLSVVVNPKVLYRHYAYATSKSQTMKDHFRHIWGILNDERPCKVLVEIGSNDGDFLTFAKENGAEAVSGIDPSENLCALSRDQGHQTFCGPFGAATASMASACLPKIDVVLARHVFCHIDDWRDFFENLRMMCSDDTLVAIEVPWVCDMLGHGEWDTIYHEHLSYLSLTALNQVLDDTPFQITNAFHLGIHGGSLLILLKRSPSKAGGSVNDLLQTESYLTVTAWNNFATRTTQSCEDINDKLSTVHRHGSHIAGLGAAAKSTVIITACELQNVIQYIADGSPLKQGMISPNGIPVVSEDGLLKMRPSHTIMFCWNFAKEALQKHQPYLEAGGKFLIPIPEVREVGR